MFVNAMSVNEHSGALMRIASMRIVVRLCVALMHLEVRLCVALMHMDVKHLSFSDENA